MARMSRWYADQMIQSLDGATVRVSLHTGNPVAPTLAEIEGGQLIGIVIDPSTYGVYPYDPYELRLDPTPSGIGDPLAEVRGLSYDQTLLAIDQALNAESAAPQPDGLERGT